MIQTVVVIVVVASAAAYVGWRLFLRGLFARRRKAAANCGPDCGCGD